MDTKTIALVILELEGEQQENEIRKHLDTLFEHSDFILDFELNNIGYLEEGERESILAIDTPITASKVMNMRNTEFTDFLSEAGKPQLLILVSRMRDQLIAYRNSNVDYLEYKKERDSFNREMIAKLNELADFIDNN